MATNKTDKEITKTLKQVKKDTNQAGEDIKKFKDDLAKMTAAGYKYSDKYGFEKNATNAWNVYNGFFNKDGSIKEGNGYNQYINDVNKLFKRVMSQEEFSYDPSKDALFQMYKQQYNAQGKRAMQNAMGVGAAYSGGYNSSAAQTAGQSQYLNYMDALNEKAAETYQNALNMYKYKQQDLYNQYNAALNTNAQSNEQFWNKVGAAATRASNLQNAWSSDNQFQYGIFSDKLNNLNTGLANATSMQNWGRNYILNAKNYTG